jgi:hypothetical protein
VFPVASLLPVDARWMPQIGGQTRIVHALLLHTHHNDL